jgi:hypothetical protein
MKLMIENSTYHDSLAYTVLMYYRRNNYNNLNDDIINYLKTDKLKKYWNDMAKELEYNRH